MPWNWQTTTLNKQAKAVLCETDNLRASPAATFQALVCVHEFPPGQLDEGISRLMEVQEIMIQGLETLMSQAKPRFYGIQNTLFLPLLTAR